MADGQSADARPGVRRLVTQSVRAAGHAGIAVAAVDYRLSGEQHWPAQLHDAKAAVRWLRQRGGEPASTPTGSLPGVSPPGPTWRCCSGRPGSAGRLGRRRPVDPPPSPPWSRGTRPAIFVHCRVISGPTRPRPTLARRCCSAHRSAPLRSWSPGEPDHVHRAGGPPILLLHGQADRLIPCAQAKDWRRRPEHRGRGGLRDLSRGRPHVAGSPEAATSALDRSIVFLRVGWGIDHGGAGLPAGRTDRLGHRGREWHRPGHRPRARGVRRGRGVLRPARPWTGRRLSRSPRRRSSPRRSR